MKTMKLITILLIGLTIISCSEEKFTPISSEDAKVSAKLDAMNDDVSSIVEEQESKTYADATTGKISDLGKSQLSNCGTISRVPDFGTAPTVGQTVTKTIDFGDGCTLNSGNIVSGKIIISFVYQPEATSHTINYTFDNFTHNGIAYNGNKTFTRTMITTQENPSPHPQVVMNMDFTATLPNGAVYQRIGSRTREIIEGYGDNILLNNIYKITGQWATTMPSGVIQNSTITTSLRVKMSCAETNKPLIVSGIITIVRQDTSATLDFGSGVCDNLAVFTVNGNSYNIVIGN